MRQIGPVTVDPQGRGIAFQVRARSIGVTPRANWVDLTRVLHFRLTDEDDVDPELVRLLREAYKVGAQDTAAPGSRGYAAIGKVKRISVP